jgi:esterase/lipase
MAGRCFTKALWSLAFLLAALVFSGLYFVFFAYRLRDIIISDSLLGSVDLDQFLLEKESRFIDLKPGAQKKIIWEDPTKKNKTEYAVVYLHGFSATHREIFPVPELVARDLGANLFLSRLPGHGRSSEAMAEPTVRDYLISAVDAYEIGRRLGDKVILLGSSTGGTLATWLATFAQDLAALILLSPNFDPKNPMAKLLLLPGGAKLARFVEGQYYEWEPQNRVQEIYWTTRYPSSALVTMEKMVSDVSKLDLSKVQVPILVVYSEDDQVVNPAETEKAFARLGAIKKEIVVFNSSADRFHHVLAGNILSPGTVEPLRKLIVDFIRRAKVRGPAKDCLKQGSEDDEDQ